MPMDEFARKLLTSKGGAIDDPASVYFAISKDTNDTLERATQVFCGVRMLCAAFETGVTLVDTAAAYVPSAEPADAGHNERIVAAALAQWGGDAETAVVV